MIDLDVELRAAEAVSDGADFMDALDEGVPRAERWYWVVEPERLDMSTSGNLLSGCGCVFGQHSPGHRFYPMDYGLSWDMAEALGFDAPDATIDFGGYRILTDLWREAINDRRAADIKRHEAEGLWERSP